MKSKTLLLSLFFGFAVVGLKAQENTKYEYAIISYSQFYKNITISIGTNEYKVVDVREYNKVSDRNFNAVLAEVYKLQDEGWSLFNTQATGMNVDINSANNNPNYLFYMRKKKQ